MLRSRLFLQHCGCDNCEATRKHNRRQRNIFFFITLPLSIAALYFAWITFFS